MKFPEDLTFKIKNFFASFIISIVVGLIIYNQRFHLANMALGYLETVNPDGLLMNWQWTDIASIFGGGFAMLCGSSVYKYRNGKRECATTRDLRIDILSLKRDIASLEHTMDHAIFPVCTIIARTMTPEQKMLLQQIESPEDLDDLEEEVNQTV